MALTKNIHNPHLLILLSIIAVLLLSCTDFFSRSWASWAARDPDKLVPKVTAGNVDEIITSAENNPDLSLSVLKKIGDAAKGKTSEDDLKKLQNSALKAATNAAGLVPAVLNVANDILSTDLSNISDEEATQMVFDAINNMKNLISTSDALREILPDPVNDPEAFENWVSEANADDLAFAAVLLIAAEVKDNEIDSIDDLKNYINENESSPNTELALAIAKNLGSRDPEDFDGPLKSILDNLGLN